MTRYLLMPLKPAPLILVAMFTLLWLVASWTRLLGIDVGIVIGIPLVLILVSWFFKYCYAVLDAIVAGNSEPPVLSVEMVNPVDEQRPVMQALIIIMGFMLTFAAYRFAGFWPALLLGAVLLSALPATIALLAIGDSWQYALWPPAICRIVRGLGRQYALVLLVTLGGAAVVFVLAAGVHSALLEFALGQLTILMVFAYIGGAVFENRIDLGMATRSQDERLQERNERDHAAVRAAALDRSYALLRLKRTRDAWQEIHTWMAAHCTGERAFSEYHVLLTATSAWDEPALADRIAEDYLGRLLAAGETGLALDVLATRLAANGGFCPTRPAHTRRLAELAQLGGRGALARQLLANTGALPHRADT